MEVLLAQNEEYKRKTNYEKSKPVSAGTAIA